MTNEQQLVADFIADRRLVRGIGDCEASCTMGSINLALSRRLTVLAPDNVSDVIALWVIVIQDGMPDELRNSPEWRRLVPLIVGTGHDHKLEQKRLEVVMAWMWSTVLPIIQPIADRHGFADAWSAMLSEKTRASSARAEAAAFAAGAEAAAFAARVASEAEETAEARAAEAAAWTARAAREAALEVTATASDTDTEMAVAMTWQTLAPAALLARLVDCEATK